MGEATTSRVLLPGVAETIGHLFWRARGRVALTLAERLPAGVDFHGYGALLALSGSVTLSQQALADTISVSRTTMVRVAAELVDRGYVVRVRNPEDRRSYALTRTPEGAAAARRWRRHAEDVEEALTVGFTVEERENLRTMLYQVVRRGLADDVPESLRDSVGFLITRAHAAIHAQFAETLAPLGIDPSQFGTLMVIEEIGPTTQAELARGLGTSSAHVVHLIDSLEESGMVQRRRSTTDRRTQLVRVLAPGRRVLVRAKPLAEAAGHAALIDLKPAESRRLLSLLRRLIIAPAS